MLISYGTLLIRGYFFILLGLHGIPLSSQAFTTLKNPIPIAHRGSSHYLPENTLEAFDHAYQMGAKYLEFDCWLSQDNQIVIMHDADVDRTTNLRGRIDSKTLEELKSADAGSWFSVEYAGYQVPTLEEVFEYAADKDLNLFIELKDPNTHLVHKTVELIEKYHFEKRVIVISFQHHLIEIISMQYPHINSAFSEGKNLEGLIDKSKRFQTTGIVAKHTLLTAEFIKKAHQEQLPVWSYTIKNTQELNQCYEMKVSGYFVDQFDLEHNTFK